MRRVSLFALFALAALAQPAAADYLILDGNRNPFTMWAIATGGKQLQQFTPSDPTGTPYSQANPQYFNLLINGYLPTIGQGTKATSIPVVPPSDPDGRPVAGTITAADVASSATTGQNGASIVTGSPTTNSAYTQAVNGVAEVLVQLSGTWVATVALERSIDGGSTWSTLPCHVAGAPHALSSATGNGLFDCVAAGATHVRARATAFTSGSVVATMTLSAVPGLARVLNPTPKVAIAALTDDSGTVTTGGTFQQIIAANGARNNCTVQNPTTATEVLYVYFGSTGAATTGKSFTLSPGMSISCIAGNTRLTAAVNVTAPTTAHAFTANDD
jgi:hypothetical protein